MLSLTAVDNKGPTSTSGQVNCLVSHVSDLHSPFVLSADWNWYSSNRISFIDSWMELKLKYGSVMTMLVSAKSTWTHEMQQRSDQIIKLLDDGEDCEREWKRSEHLEHLFSKQMIPHFPLDVPVDKVTLKKKWQSLNEALWVSSSTFLKLQHWLKREYTHSPSGTAGCRRDRKDLWSHPADWLWRSLTVMSWSETDSLGWHWRTRRERGSHSDLK